MTTAKQALVKHFSTFNHGGAEVPTRATHDQLVIRHRNAHARQLTHRHTNATGYWDGQDTEQVMIYLAPPRNPRSPDAHQRRWTLSIYQPGIAGWKRELIGTCASDSSEDVQAAANKLLKFEANWAVSGWGFAVHDPEWVYEAQCGTGRPQGRNT